MESILQEIKDEGFRVTKIRKAMIAILFGNKCLLSSSEIQSKLLKMHLKADRSTIYRELCFLLEKNIIKKIQIADNKTYYEIFSKESHHHHLICIKCEKVKGIALGHHLEDQEKKIYTKEKFKVFSHSLEFYGLCQKCRLIN